MTVDNTIKLDGCLIKKLCSGGDKIQTRINNKEENDCKPQQLLFFVAMIYQK